MHTSVLNRLFLKLEVRDCLSDDEKSVLAAAASSEEVVLPGQDIATEHERQTLSRLLVDGLAARAKTLPTGARQITELHLPGDFMDLHSFLLKKLDHSVVALTRVKILNFPHENLKRISETHPHLSRLLWLSTLMDAAIHREWLVSAGRRSAAQHIGSLFCEMMIRYRTVGLSDGRKCPLKITQEQMADVTGLSTVHVNRVMQELRAARLVEWRSGELTIYDFDKLADFALFDETYLVLEREPR